MRCGTIVALAGIAVVLWAHPTFCEDTSAIVAIEAEPRDIPPDPAPATEASGGTDEKNEKPHKVFVPTDEWQDVEPGQHIPPGLHVSIDLQTGRKRAKLMEEDQGKRTLSEKRAEKLQAMDQVLEGLNTTDGKQGFHAKADELDEAWADKHQPKLDLSGSLSRAMRRFADEQTVERLEELEDLLHDRELAIDFAAAGGLKTLADLLPPSIKENMTQDSTATREAANGPLIAQACVTIGAASQNNPELMNKEGLETIVYRLVDLLRSGEDARIRKSAIYALSSLLRLRSTHIYDAFVYGGGFEVISTLLREETTRSVLVKLVVLVTDLTVQQATAAAGTFDGSHEEKRLEMLERLGQHSGKTHVLTTLASSDICRDLFALLRRQPSTDTMEKALELLVVTGRLCSPLPQDLQRSLAASRSEWSLERDEYFDNLAHSAEIVLGRNNS